MDVIKRQLLNNVTGYTKGQIQNLKAYTISIVLIYWKKIIPQSFLLVILTVLFHLQISKDIVLSCRSLLHCGSVVLTLAMLR